MALLGTDSSGEGIAVIGWNRCWQQAAVSQPWEGGIVRSRLWALILRELPFPFRELGTEIIRTLTWIDSTAARLWIGFTRSPAWYVVTLMGTFAFLLTGLLFSSFVATHDPTLKQLVKRGQKLAPATRETLEEAGDWAAQDKWRLAHFFVEHRPPRRFNNPRIDSSMLDDFAPTAAPRRFNSRRPAPRYEPQESLANLILPETEVQLDLGRPKVAEEPKRLVYGQYVREVGSDFSIRPVANYRSRESRLLVQAEWSFAAECDSQPVPRPTRRIIPVPEPEFDELPAVTERPDLSFQMSMLREFLPATGEFPARSRLASVTAHSEFPPFPQKRRSPFDPDAAPWAQTTRQSEPQRPSEAYVDRTANDFDSIPPNIDLERALHANTAPSFAEVALRLELKAPESTVTGRVTQSSVVIHNDGLREIPIVTVREPLAHLDTVTDAIPPARVHQLDNSLERSIEHLEAGQHQRLELVWRPDSEGIRRHSALVTVHTLVGATTEIVAPEITAPMPSVAPEQIPERDPEPTFDPEPIAEPEPVPVPKTRPEISLDVQNEPSAKIDDLVEIAITVRNTGDVPLHDVRVRALLPGQLKHPQGSEVEYTIRAIPVSGSQKAVLRTVADSSGKAICRFEVTAAEPTEAKSKAVVEVAAQPAPLPIAKTEPRKAPATPITIPKRPGPAPTSAPAKPAGNCCCQSQPAMMLDYDPWYGP